MNPRTDPHGSAFSSVCAQTRGERSSAQEGMSFTPTGATSDLFVTLHPARQARDNAFYLNSSHAAPSFRTKCLPPPMSDGFPKDHFPSDESDPKAALALSEESARQF